MYTFLDENLNERSLPEGVRITDGPRKTWFENSWPNTSIFVYTVPESGEPFYATLTETAIKLNVAVRTLGRLIEENKDYKNNKLYRVPKSIFVQHTGRNSIWAWNYFWKY